MTSRRNRIRRLWRQHRAAISFATGLVLGAVSSAAIYAVVSGDLTGGEPRTVFRLPSATGPSTLHDISIDDIKQMLGDRGFTCTTATPRTGEDRRTSYRCGP